MLMCYKIPKAKGRVYGLAKTWGSGITPSNPLYLMSPCYLRFYKHNSGGFLRWVYGQTWAQWNGTGPELVVVGYDTLPCVGLQYIVHTILATNFVWANPFLPKFPLLGTSQPHCLSSYEWCPPGLALVILTRLFISSCCKVSLCYLISQLDSFS